MTRELAVAVVLQLRRKFLALLLAVDPVAFDFLVQRRQRNLEALGSLGLAPSGPFETLKNHSPFERIDDVR